MATDDIVLEAGTGLSIARSGDKITFTNTVSDTDTQLTTEQVQDIVGAMFSSNTETRISVTYQDADGTIDLVVDDMTANDNTQNTYAISCVDGDNSDEEKIRLTQGGADGVATDDVVLEAGTGLSIARSGDKITFTNTVTDTNTQLSTEQVQDIVGAMFSSNTETRISATYEDGDGTIDLVVDDMTANDNTTYSVSCVDGDNSDEEKIRLTDSSGTTDDVVLEAGTGLSIARSGDKITFTNTVSDTNTQLSTEEVQDIAGAMFSSNTESGVTATYQDADGTIDLEIDAAQTTITSIINSSLTKIGTATDQEYIDFSTANEVNIKVNDTEQLSATSSGIDISTELNTAKNVFAKTANTDFSVQGDIVKIGTGSTTQGELCYYKSDGSWAAADADAAATSGGCLLAIALGTDPDSDGMLLRGMFTLDHDPGTVADVLYVSTTAGDITSTAPSGNGDIVRIVGYCLDSSNGQIWFNPSNDFIEITA